MTAEINVFSVLAKILRNISVVGSHFGTRFQSQCVQLKNYKLSINHIIIVLCKTSGVRAVSVRLRINCVLYNRYRSSFNVQHNLIDTTNSSSKKQNSIADALYRSCKCQIAGDIAFPVFRFSFSFQLT